MDPHSPLAMLSLARSGRGGSLGRARDVLEGALIWPARIFGLIGRGGLLTTGAVLSVLLFPALLSLKWISSFESGRERLLSQLPGRLMTSLMPPFLSATLLLLALALLVGINRAWSANERLRWSIVFGVSGLKADDLPDMRAIGVVSLLFFLPLLPLLFLNLNVLACSHVMGSNCLFVGENTLVNWASFLAQTALPMPIEERGATPLSPASFGPYILSLTVIFPLTVLLAWLELSRSKRLAMLAIDSLGHTDALAVATGRRLLPRLTQVIADGGPLPPPFYENAARALGRLGDRATVLELFAVIAAAPAGTRRYALQALATLTTNLADREPDNPRMARQVAQLRSGVRAFLKHKIKSESEPGIRAEMERLAREFEV